MLNSMAADAQLVDKVDNAPPIVKILKPTYCSSIVAGKLLVEGSASDIQSGIKHVEALSHTYPYDNSFLFHKATPKSSDDWSAWSILVDVQGSRPNRILVRATDNAGNENWDEFVVDVRSNPNLLNISGPASSGIRIGIVLPSFTEAAYNVDSFYSFYDKYQYAPTGVEITSDINLLTGNITDIPTEFLTPVIDQIRNFSSNITISLLDDANVHDGLLFDMHGTNAFDMLLLLHNEYETREAYNNLRTFTRNGGIIVFLDANVFIAEVKYDETRCSVTLVRGHHWEFDGYTARRSVAEHFSNENIEWIGGNFIDVNLAEPVQFSNNPFNYTHFEENALINANAKVLFDYGASFSRENTNPLLIALQNLVGMNKSPTVATYEMSYGKGKIIMLGIYGQNLVNNTAFLNFFDRIILMHAIAPTHQVVVDGKDITIYWKMKTGRVTEVKNEKSDRQLTFVLERSRQEADNLTILLPRELVDTPINLGISNLTIISEGKPIPFDHTDDDVETALVIPLSDRTKSVQVIWQEPVPESTPPIVILIALMVSVGAIFFIILRFLSKR
jgi:hypothetical protein